MVVGQEGARACYKASGEAGRQADGRQRVGTGAVSWYVRNGRRSVIDCESKCKLSGVRHEGRTHAAQSRPTAKREAWRIQLLGSAERPKPSQLLIEQNRRALACVSGKGDLSAAAGRAPRWLSEERG